ncbi:phosphopentomutase [Leeia oryzae]|uniref:phosphopentomutase n=1 Tax=Leeia oryzae TaxID=356662 RepID=UPI000372A625|nr:phosphopentomutase [Leeia oryzae]
MRAIILIMDSLGVGATPDADRFGDVGSNTLGHIAAACAEGRAEEGRSGALHIPHLEQLGLGMACKLATGEMPAGLSASPLLTGSYGAAKEASSGKDTPSGHWEIAGVPVRFDWGYFEKKTESFPPQMLENIVRRAGIPGFLGNCHASGTTILDELGEAHMQTGKPIFYTSADSVFQIACHEETFGLQRLYDLCEIAREEVDTYNICRVIARPFVGSGTGDFRRTGNRHDLAVAPPADTLLKKLTDAGGEVVSIGKIADIYAHVGITRKLKGTGLDALWNQTLACMDDTPDNSIIMTNFVDFDEKFGHRRNVPGYAAAMEYFDTRLPELQARLKAGDVVVISADHGCDPTWVGSDHTREHIPVLVFGPGIAAVNLGVRESFADIGQSLAQGFGLSAFPDGNSFWPEIQS